LFYYSGDYYTIYFLLGERERGIDRGENWG
jgi:hypothetical protein